LFDCLHDIRPVREHFITTDDDYALREWHLIYVNHSGGDKLPHACLRSPAASPSGGGSRGFPALRVSGFGYGGIVRGKDQSHDRPPPSS